MTNSFCVNNDFGRLVRFSLAYFFLNSARLLDVLETLSISEIVREQLRNQQHLFHNHSEQ